MEIYLVGGAVRDKIMGIESKDNDYVVCGSTPEEMIALGFKQVGADFPVFLHPETGDEYALARTEKKTGVGYNGFTCVFSPDVTITEDLYRRDLTINSIAYDQAADMYIDPYGGRYDIHNKIIRSTNPNAFADDPVRVLRACRFAARYNFGLDKNTVDLMKQCVDNEFDNLTPERVWKEIEKGLLEGAYSFYDMLCCLDLADAFKKLKPFYCLPSYHQQMKIASIHGASSEVAFAIVSSHFIKADFVKWKIPNTYSELSLINSSLNYGLNRKSAVEILNFIEMSGAMKSDVRYNDISMLIDIKAQGFYHLFRVCVNKLKEIDNVAIIGDEKNGQKIKELVRLERLRVITSIINSPVTIYY